MQAASLASRRILKAIPSGSSVSDPPLASIFYLHLFCSLLCIVYTACHWYSHDGGDWLAEIRLVMPESTKLMEKVEKKKEKETKRTAFEVRSW